MKSNTNLSLAVIASFAIILPISAFADEQNQDEKKQGKQQGASQQQAGRGAQKAAAPGPATPAARSYGGGSPRSAANVGSPSGGQRQPNRAPSSGPATVQRPNVAAVSSQPVNRAASQQRSRAQETSGQQPNQAQASARQQRNQAQVTSGQQPNQAQVAARQHWNRSQLSPNLQQSQAPAYTRQQMTKAQAYSSPQYNSGNNYGGNWYPAHTHSDWNQHQQYYWNNHNYQWYNNGWLIIDAGFNPYYLDSGYSNRGYLNGSSTVANVQSSLASQGYYRGLIDGDAGPGTRNAIASYQSDNGLRVTGRINDPLLQSLQLE